MEEKDGSIEIPLTAEELAELDVLRKRENPKLSWEEMLRMLIRRGLAAAEEREYEEGRDEP